MTAAQVKVVIPYPALSVLCGTGRLPHLLTMGSISTYPVNFALIFLTEGTDSRVESQCWALLTGRHLLVTVS